MSCGKEAFLTFGLADRVAKMARNRREGSRLQPYRCRECGAWHVGSSLGRRETRQGYMRVVDSAA